MSNNSLSKDTIRRLEFIKYLLSVAVGQSHQPEPLAAEESGWATDVSSHLCHILSINIS